MKRQSLRIELLSDCVFSASSATAGAHAGLDRVPGHALLGAAAARLYPRLSQAAAFAAFHSGRLRFGDGLPATDGGTAYPVPQSWHYPKEGSPDNPSGWLDGATIINHVRPVDEQGVQHEQLRAGYVRPADGRWLKPARNLRLKTAIDADTGRAAEGQLFGYDALSRGQVFHATIEADPDIDGDLFRQVVDALDGEQLLGRSRSAEYGRVRIEPVELDPPQPGSPPAATGSGHELVLWLLSDVALTDDCGRPTLTPDPEGLGLGLGPGRIDWTRTFLRSRSWSPWNAHRGGFDRERTVLSAGGVITLQLEQAPSQAALARLMAGIGLYREGGLGHVWANPPLLAAAHPAFATSPKRADPKPPPRPDHPLIAWLEGHADTRQWQIQEHAENLAAEIQELLESGRKLNGVASDQSFGPSASQWSGVCERAKGARKSEATSLHKGLFDSKRGVIKPNAEGWQEEVRDPDTGNRIALARWLQAQVDPERVRDRFDRDYRDGRDYGRFLAHLAHRMQEQAQRRVTSGRHACQEDA